MEVKTIIQEIQRLPLSKRFLVMEQTLKSIKKEELYNQSEKEINSIHDDYSIINDLTENSYSVNEKSLSKDWLSEEDERWDKVL